MKECVVYKHTNLINGKAYIGWTSLTIDERWNWHCRSANSGSISIFHKAIKKYGVNVWKHEILETFYTEDDAKNAEIKCITEHQTFCYEYPNKGYNMTQGGEGLLGFHHALETKVKISKSLLNNKCGHGNKGRIWTNEQRQQISQTLTGRIRPIEERIKISEALRRRVRRPETLQKIREKLMKPVTQLTLDGVIIKEYINVGSAAKDNKISCKKIRHCCNGKITSHNGFIWCWSKI
jgi:group I intron endonuclease